MHELTSSNVVSVKAIGGDSPQSEVLFESKADGRLSCTAETSEPDAAAPESTTLPNHLTTFVPSHMTGFECHIGRLH